ncbi:MAG: hypothetical protein ACQEQD_04115 [Bacillota bacterium]
MGKGKAVQNKIKLNNFQNKLKKTDKKSYYLFLIGFNLGLDFDKIFKLNKKEVKNIIKKRKKEIIRKNKLVEINNFLENYDEKEILFSDKEKIYSTIKKIAEKVGLNNFGTETMQRSFAYFHYQYFQDIDRIKDLLGLVSPTAALHYMGYKDDRYLCFYCNRGCIYRKKYK